MSNSAGTEGPQEVHGTLRSLLAGMGASELEELRPTLDHINAMVEAATGQGNPSGGFVDRLCGHPAKPDAAIPEPRATLAIQQRELLAGIRNVMAFKEGGAPLPLPEGFERMRFGPDTYDFNPKVYRSAQIIELIQADRIGEALRLGPITKTEAVQRREAGEEPVAVVERTPQGIEVRAAMGTIQTAPEQTAYFMKTQNPENTVQVEDVDRVMLWRIMGLIEDVRHTRTPPRSAGEA
jgi:hypothetical protein